MKKFARILMCILIVVLVVAFWMRRQIFFKMMPFAYHRPPPFMTGFCSLSSGDKLRFHSMRVNKLDKLESNLREIIELAGRVNYDSTKLKYYQKELLVFKQTTPPDPCTSAVIFSGKTFSGDIRPLIDSIKWEFRQVREFVENKKGED